MSRSISPSSSASRSLSPSASQSQSASPSEAIPETIETEALNGVYTLGNYAPNYPIVLDLTYPISQRSGSDFVLHNVEIGSICVAGDDILISWYDHTTREFGIDKVDWETKLDGAYIDTKLLPVYRRSFANYTAYLVSYADLPTGTSVEMYYSTDYGENYSLITTVDDTDRQIVIGYLTVEATQIMLRVKLRTTSNDGPVIDSAGIQVS